MAKIALDLDRPDPSLTLLGAVDAAFAAWDIVLPPAEADAVAQTRAAASGAIGNETAATRAWEQGTRLSLHEAIVFALTDLLPGEDKASPS